MEFKSGDDVVHPDYGVGNIVRLEDRQLAESVMRQYYVLAFGNMLVWSPVQANAASPLRRVTARQDLDHYRTLLKSRPTPLDRDYRKRRLDLQEHLAHGSFQEVCEVVRDLTALGWYKPIGEVDASVLKRARTMLWQEWATSTSQPLPAAIREVTDLLEAGKQTYKT